MNPRHFRIVPAAALVLLAARSHAARGCAASSFAAGQPLPTLLVRDHLGEFPLESEKHRPHREPMGAERPVLAHGHQANVAARIRCVYADHYTLAARCGLAPMDAVDGRDIASLLAGGTTPVASDRRGSATARCRPRVWHWCIFP